MDAKQKEAALAKLELEKKKQTDRLIKSVIDLNKTFIKTGKKEDEEDKKKSKLGSDFSMKSLADAFKQKGADKVKSVKDMFSIKNALSLMGQGEGTMLGELAQNREEKMTAKVDEVKKVSAAAQIYATESAPGQLHAQKRKEYEGKEGGATEEERLELEKEMEELLKKGTEWYEKRLEIAEQIAKLEKESEEARDAGVDVDPAKLQKIEDLKNKRAGKIEAKKEPEKTSWDYKDDKYKNTQKQLEKKGDKTSLALLKKANEQEEARKNASDKKLTAPPKAGAPTEDMMSVLERKMREADMKQHPELYPELAETNTTANTTTANTTTNEELEIENKQLKVLTKIENAVTVSEEDRLESKKPESTVEKIKKETPADPVQKKSILDRAKDLAESVRQRGKDLLNKLKGSPGESFVQRAKNGAGSILKSGSTIAGSAASAGGGILSSAGSLVSKVALPALAVAGAGAAGYAAGQWLNENTDIQKNIAGGVDTVKGWFGNSDEDKQKEAEKKATQDLYDKRVQEGKLTPKAAEYFEKHGIKVDKTKINTVANLEKPATTSREVQTANLEQSTAEAATIAAKETAGTNKGPAVVDASVKSITNNNSVHTKPSPPVRNFEPSFNTRLRSQFA